MITTKLKVGIVCTIVFASVATPLVIRNHVRVKWGETNESLRRQADRLAQFAAENDRLSNIVAQAKAPLSNEELRELLRLRNEVGQLRTQTNAIQKLREQNSQFSSTLTTAQNPPTQMSPSERDEKLAVETTEAMRNISRELQHATQKFATDHNGKPPRDFSELRDYFPTSDGNRMAGLYSFEFVRYNGLKPGDTLILRERGLHKNPDGKWARVYAFSDGMVVEVTSPNEDSGTYFDIWEKQHMTSSPSGQ